jgi:hypothetical protein
MKWFWIALVAICILGYFLFPMPSYYSLYKENKQLKQQLEQMLAQEANLIWVAEMEEGEQVGTKNLQTGELRTMYSYEYLVTYLRGLEKQPDGTYKPSVVMTDADLLWKPEKKGDR